MATLREEGTYQMALSAMGAIRRTADDTWQTSLRFDDDIQMLGSLISGLSGTHLFERGCLDLETIGSLRYR